MRALEEPTLKSTLERVDKAAERREDARKAERLPLETAREISDYKYKVATGALATANPGFLLLTPITDKLPESDQNRIYNQPLEEIDKKYADITRLQIFMEVRKYANIDPADVNALREEYIKRGRKALAVDRLVKGRADLLHGLYADCCRRF